MGRSPCCDKNGLKKGPWTPEEDQKLIDYIQKHGHGSWRTLPKNAGLQRCGKSCRLRWTNYLRPDIKRGRFSFEEEETIIQLHSVLGNKWSAIAARLPGRTDNEIKNYWNTHIRKRLLRMGIDPVTHSPRLDLLDLSSIFNSPLYNPSHHHQLSRLLALQPLVNPELLRLATTLLSSSSSSASLHNAENPDLQYLQNLQETQLCINPQMQQTQLIPPLIEHSLIHQDQIQASSATTATATPTTTSTLPCSSSATFLNEPDHNQVPHHHLMQPNVEQFQSNLSYQNCQPSLWQDNVMNQSTDLVSADNFAAAAISNLGLFYGSDQSSIVDPLSENSSFPSNNNANFGFTSVLSTPSSSPTQLTASCSTEDERDSYCSDLLKFEIPATMLDVNDYL